MGPGSQARLETAKRLPRGVGLRGLARRFQIFFAGVLDLWVQNELSDARFPVQVRYGALLKLPAIGDLDEQAPLMRELRQGHQRLQKSAGEQVT